MKLFKKKEKNCCNVQCGDGSTTVPVSEVMVL